MSWTIIVGLLAAGAGASQGAWLEHVEQRVQEKLQKDNVTLSREGYALELTTETSSAVRITLIGLVDGPRLETIVTNLPSDVEAASTEIGLTVVSMLPKVDGEDPPPPEPREIELSSASEPATSMEFPDGRLGPAMNDSDQYYLSLALAIGIGFGVGHLMMEELRGVVYLVVQTLALGTVLTGGGLYLRDNTSDAAIGLLIGGAIAYGVAHLAQLVDFLVFVERSNTMVSVAPIPTRGGFAPAVVWSASF